LIAAPAGAALRLTDRPFVGMGVAAGLSVVSTVVGLTVSYAFPQVLPSFGVIATAALVYASTFLPGAPRVRFRSRLSRRSRGVGEDVRAGSDRGSASV
jgi:zinc/manganese transport system permease protein